MRNQAGPVSEYTNNQKSEDSTGKSEKTSQIAGFRNLDLSESLNCEGGNQYAKLRKPEIWTYRNLIFKVRRPKSKSLRTRRAEL